ncbi:UNVERIFIED_ORG: multidrug resistance efflux pump [Idiomarina abyssalis]|uniref:HlyD family secretion protein n=1 Tax=Idiomarina sp. 017G TaxID=2183988 RepID=UPI000E0F54C9|nr:HlyD family secretion protein [Idiomarina sp. 017G]TDO48772.1 multidrug resistance efflux pump [Idiomarina sp. 017G]
MTADEKFARWVKRALVLFVLIFAYFLWADLSLPLTPQAMVTRVVTQVAPQVNGTVEKVLVNNNQYVEEGEPLFEIDPRPYQLQLQQAELAMAQAQQSNQQFDAQIRTAQAKIKSAQATAQELSREARRIKDLVEDGSSSQQAYDRAQSSKLEALANVEAAQSQLQSLKVQRGAEDDANNLLIQQAENAIETARLNLSYTTVRAKHAGRVGNLKLSEGAYARQGTPLMALVSPNADIIADFREKNLRSIESGQQALVVFDAEPGTLYEAKVESIDAGVNAGQLSADGALAAPVNSNRWVRDAQRLRVHLSLAEQPDSERPAGAKATVQIVPEGSFKAAIAKAQIRLLGWLHYIY